MKLPEIPPPTATPEKTIRVTASAEDQRIAFFAAAAITLSLIDAAIPMPLPGVKPGFANIVTLIVLARFGWHTAAWVTGLRVLVGSLILGSFLTPGFFLACSGALASLIVLAIVRHLPRRLFGPVSWSLCAAFAHFAGQLLFARFWLFQDDGVFFFIPLFAVAAVVFGTINGLIAARLLNGQSGQT